MFQVKSITLSLGEGPIAMCDKPKVFSTWATAEKQLRDWSYSACYKGMLGCLKTDFKIVYEDDQEYKGTYELRHGDGEIANLAAHVRSYLEFMTGRKCPPHLRQEQYDGYIKAYVKDEGKRDAEQFLRDYQIGE